MSDAERLLGASALHVEAVAELLKVLEIFDEDIKALGEPGPDSPHVRRTLVRTVLASLEGITHQLCQIVVTSIDLGSTSISRAEEAMLREEKYYLDDKGEADSRESYQRLAPRIRLVFATFARVHSVAFTANYDGAGWKAVKESIKVRNRLMHPKSSEELTVSKRELLSAVDATRWFHRSTLDLLTACHSKVEG